MRRRKLFQQPLGGWLLQILKEILLVDIQLAASRSQWIQISEHVNVVIHRRNLKHIARRFCVEIGWERLTVELAVELILELVLELALEFVFEFVFKFVFEFALEFFVKAINNTSNPRRWALIGNTRLSSNGSDRLRISGLFP